MTVWRGLLREGKTRWLQTFAANRRRLASGSPFISFTFDDVPLSAYRNAVPMLKAFGLKATFYVCAGLEKQDAAMYLGPNEIKELARGGHDIACHTYSHYRLSNGSVAGLALDAARNRERLREILGVHEKMGFSFPFGEMSFAAKRSLSNHYTCLRSNRQGINSGVIDLNCLKAVALYETSCSLETIESWLHEAIKRKGWLIFYTHGVSEDPGDYDVGVETFYKVLKVCGQYGVEILPVSAIVSYNVLSV